MKFDPFAQMGKVWETWAQMTEDSITRATAFYAEMDKVQAKGVERLDGAITEAAKLSKETVAYGAELGAAWRKLSLESMKRATSAFAAGDAAAH